MSATVTEDVEGLKGMMTRNPAILKLEEEKPDGDLVQYSIVTTEKDKFLLIFSILKLKLIRGKILIFVNDVDRCYRLKLLLEQFGIKSCVLNSELPLNSRCHIVQEFNKGVYDYLIATDEASLQQVESESEGDSDSEGEDFRQRKRAGKKDEPDAEAEGSDSEARAASQRRQRGRRKPRQDKEYGVSRGGDFKNVACVLNFDFPASARAYVHRVGRTARAGKRGMALSFVVPPSGGKRSRAADDEKVLGRVERLLRRGNGAGIPPDAAAAPDGKESDRFIKPYAFNVRQVEGFRYRLEDAMRSVTRVAIREARVKELKAEILNSEKLKAHFEDKPRDLAFLRHDKALRPARVQPHLKHVPSYLMPKLSAPPAGAAAAAADGAAFGRGRGGGGGEAKLARQERRGLRARPGPGGKDNSSRGKRKKADPLKSFSFPGTKGGGRIGKRTRGAGKRAR
ncbi:MAG: P-loop containing nucleoside triphosphate hydrolase protein [Olpidium bornovanus]|uniref:RNA helicase n=1 Tax=Olpidium bornovanus TaxID=278681 RepID=A0A8H7ZZF3_9FUNG|nr:MAG: P-loop containing nucleoside triphosphate hydrolase protein [Olpidium bornovanus]